MTADSIPPESSDQHALDAQASVLMKRGIRRLGDADPGAVSDALDCFDRALELRRRLPIATSPLFRYGLAACWLNRADALMRMGGTEAVALAVNAYDEALMLLLELPLADDPRFPRRLAIAHQNRGLALQAEGRSPAPAVSAAFSEAIAVLEHDHSAGLPDREYLLAAVWMNLANVLASEAVGSVLQVTSDRQARTAADRALALVANLEASDANAAEVGLKARHVLCHVMARHLAAKTSSHQAMPDDVHATTDLVDDGLGLVRRWEQHGVSRFRRIGCDLFRFGARVYQRYQPHFVPEFVLENLDPARSSTDYVESAEMRAAAEAILERATHPPA